MSKVQERGLLEALGEAEGLARVLRAMSDGVLDLVPVVTQAGTRPLELSWEQARAEARLIAGQPASSAAHADPPEVVVREAARMQRLAETFCSVCGPLDEPGVHTMADCPRYELLPATVTPMVITDDIALNMAANVLEAMRPVTSYHKKIIQTLRNLLPEAEGKVQGKPYQEQTGKWGQPDRAATSQSEGS